MAQGFRRALDRKQAHWCCDVVRMAGKLTPVSQRFWYSQKVIATGNVNRFTWGPSSVILCDHVPPLDEVVSELVHIVRFGQPPWDARNDDIFCCIVHLWHCRSGAIRGSGQLSSRLKRRPTVWAGTQYFAA
jgi:hypothetical protein